MLRSCICEAALAGLFPETGCGDIILGFGDTQHDVVSASTMGLR